jgi:hypothetical protein
LCPAGEPPDPKKPADDDAEGTDPADDPDKTNPNIKTTDYMEDVNNGSIKIIGDEEFRDGVKADLDRIGSTDTGKALLAEIDQNHQQTGKQVDICMGSMTRPACGGPESARVDADGNPGTPAAPTVSYVPQNMEPMANPSPGTTTDVILVHELDHASRVQNGTVQSGNPSQSDPTAPHDRR